jgi:UDPglucose--hexose-1-phosphate uridylyltransferase
MEHDVSPGSTTSDRSGGAFPADPVGAGPGTSPPDAVAVARHDLRRADGRRLLVYGRLRGDLTGDSIEPVELPALQQRLDRLSDAWVAVSPARNARPNSALDARRPDGPGCPLCPGGPEVPFPYDAAVFENRWPSFTAVPPPVADDPRLARSLGRCEVVLYTEGHEGSIATLEPSALARVLAIWRDRSAELWAVPAHRFVLVFENRGAAVGATISHPHGQIYAFDRVPPFIAGRVGAQARHRASAGTCLACEVVAEDDAASERRVMAGEHFSVAVPFAARWPYEIHIRARRHGLRRLADLAPAEQVELAGLIRDVVLRYDGLFDFELPYIMGIHEGPDEAADWHLSVEFQPPHRSAELTKIRASVETFSGLFINDTLPEDSAARLAAVSVAARDEQPVPSVVVPVAVGAPADAPAPTGSPAPAHATRTPDR